MSTGEQIRLGDEIRHYQSIKSELLSDNEGKFVVIKGNTVAGVFESFECAYVAGAERFGTDTDFLIKQILRQDPVFVLYA